MPNTSALAEKNWRIKDLESKLARADRLAQVLRMVEQAIEEDGWHDHVDDQAHTVAELVVHEVREALAAYKAGEDENSD